MAVDRMAAIFMYCRFCFFKDKHFGYSVKAGKKLHE